MPEALELAQWNSGTGGAAISKRYIHAPSSGATKTQSIEAALRSWARSGAAYYVYENVAGPVGTPSLLTGLLGAGGAGLPAFAGLASKQPRAALNEFEQYTIPNWDGGDAMAIRNPDLEYARSLLDTLEFYIPTEPDAAPGQDGSICMEWLRDTRSGTNKLFLDIAPGDRVLIYLKCSGLSPIERHFRKQDTDLLTYLQTAFLMFSAS